MKKYIAVFLAILLIAGLLPGCGSQKEAAKSTHPTVDYSQYAFVGISWQRDAEDDTETIYFGADGSFRYYCGCGNPVNDSDLCEGYTYEDATKTITLKCSMKTFGMVTRIRIVECDETSLHLDFNGDIRIFEKG